MKLLLEGLLMALVLMCALVGVVTVGRHTVATETHPSAVGSFTIVASGDGDEAYRWVEWDASCSVWDVQSEGDIVEVNSPEAEGAITGEAKDCRGGHLRAHIATTRQPGAVRPTGGHRAESTSENPPSRQ
jgi:hypothetical protein